MAAGPQPLQWSWAGLERSVQCLLPVNLWDSSSWNSNYLYIIDHKSLELISDLQGLVMRYESKGGSPTVRGKKKKQWYRRDLARRWLDAASNENLLDLSSSNVSGTTREKRQGKTDILIWWIIIEKEWLAKLREDYCAFLCENAKWYLSSYVFCRHFWKNIYTSFF